MTDEQRAVLAQKRAKYTARIADLEAKAVRFQGKGASVKLEKVQHKVATVSRMIAEIDAELAKDTT